jgi:hypothetical protein
MRDRIAAKIKNAKRVELKMNQSSHTAASEHLNEQQLRTGDSCAKTASACARRNRTPAAITFNRKLRFNVTAAASSGPFNYCFKTPEC